MARTRRSSGESSRWLAGVSAAQLAIGVAGMAVALRRRHPCDVAIVRLHGSPETIARDSLVIGTALSAPVVMLAAQAAALASVTRGGRGWAEPALGGLGAIMVPGYLSETLVRRRLRRSGWDGVESPLLVAGIALATAMAALGRPAPR